MSKALPRCAAPLLGALAALAAAGALAQTPAPGDPLDDRSNRRLDRMEKVVRELRAIVYQGRDTGHPVVVQPSDTDARLSALSDKLGDVQQSISHLNGELEVVRHDLDIARQSASDLRAENAVMQAKIAALEAAPRGPAPGGDNEAQAAPPPPVAAPPTPTPTAQLATAEAAVNAGDPATAEPLLADYVAEHGDGPRGPEAKYYYARVLIARKAWADAATNDIGAIRGWPKTRWAPGAITDLARSLIALKKPADACQALDELQRRYPTAPPSVKADATDLRARAKCG